MNYIRCPEDKYILRPMWDGEDLFLVCPDCGLKFQWDNLEERNQLKLEKKPFDFKLGEKNGD